MHHQKIPSYTGAQPFIYAVYCKEDEALAFPVLARMYNEGFRICCAPATGIASDFYTMQRLSSAAGVIIFSSQQLAERMRTGDPDIIAAARSAVLRTVIRLDDTDISNSAFAMSVPDHESYRRENDSAFWLYMYSNDHFDCCRGPWPENKLLLRNPTYEDLNEEVVNEEYVYLESIMSGSGKKKEEYDPFNPDNLYKNNEGYVEPEPDEFVYTPLEKVKAVRTKQDDEYDELIGRINRAEDAAAESRRRAEEAKQQSVKAEAEKIEQKQTEEADASEAAQEEPERESKADRVVVFAEDAQNTAEKIKEEAVTEELLAPAVSEEENIIAAQLIMTAAQVLRAEKIQHEAEKTQQTVEEQPVEAVPELPAAPAVQQAQTTPGRSSVPVMVKRQSAPAARRVTPVKCKIIHAGELAEGEKNQTPSANDGIMPSFSDSAAFEQYIREIAMSVVNSGTAEAEEQPAVSARKHRQRNASAEAEGIVQNIRNTVAAEIVSSQPSAAEASADTDEEPRSMRKNRHPHQKGSILTEIVKALRNAKSEEMLTAGEDEALAEAAGEAVEEITDEIIVEANAEIEMPKVNDLQAAVEKFMEINAMQPRMVVAKTIVRRCRD